MKVIFFICVVVFPVNFLSATFNLDVSVKQATSASSQQSSPNSVSNSTETQPSSLILSSEMSQQQQQSTGINQLNEEQQQALASWIENWAQTQAENPKLQANQVAAILGDGQFVKLGNGDVYTISPNAWLYTYYWKPGDTIEVKQSQDTLFPISLVNKNYSQNVTAQQANSQVQKSFGQSYTIAQIRGGGQFVKLSNGSLWQIDPATRYQAAGWSEGQQVFVIQNKQSSGGGYALMNGDTSRTVYANRIRGGNSLKSNAQNGHNNSSSSATSNSNESSVLSQKNQS